MAAHGYESERFESTVDTERYSCPICLNVVKDPVMCSRNEHLFCRGCIVLYLTNNQTCPVCTDALTHDTLKKPSRFFTEILSELRIRCEYVERGCEKIVQLQNLEKHVGECGFAPVRCSNEGCQREVNRRDLNRHEYEQCEHRKLVKCHKCERLSQDVDILKQKVTGMEEKVDTAVKKIESLQKHFEDQQRNMDDSLWSLKRSNSSIEGNLEKLVEVMESLPKKSKPDADSDNSDHDLLKSESRYYPTQPARFDTLTSDENNSAPSTLSRSSLPLPTFAHWSRNTTRSNERYYNSSPSPPYRSRSSTRLNKSSYNTSPSPPYRPRNSTRFDDTW